MKKILTAALILVAAMSISQAQAEEGQFSIGAGSKSVSIIITSPLATTTYSWAGLALVGGYHVTDNISLIAEAYSLIETADANSKMRGYDVDVRFGSNTKGFTYFGALGYFNDKWNGSTLGISSSYSGTQFGAGIGYAWESAELNWNILSIRSVSDYQGASTNDYVVVTGGLSLAYRF